MNGLEKNRDVGAGELFAVLRVIDCRLSYAVGGERAKKNAKISAIANNAMRSNKKSAIRTWLCIGWWLRAG